VILLLKLLLQEEVVEVEEVLVEAKVQASLVRTYTYLVFC
jgi:hypothetical protein